MLSFSNKIGCTCELDGASVELTPGGCTCCPGCCCSCCTCAW